jgi:hypothetical protein
MGLFSRAACGSLGLLAAIVACCGRGDAAEAPRHVVYVHGKAVEDGGRRPTTKFGVYEYDAILAALGKPGFVVTSEQRPRDADPHLYARHVADEVRELLKQGVPASHITVIGASKGAVITMIASTMLQQPDVRYVLLGACNDAIIKSFDIRLSGHVLSVFEASDEYGQSCAPFFARAGALRSHDERALKLGISHSFLYTPRDEWLAPALAWIREEPLQ